MSEDGFQSVGKGRFRVDRKRALSKLERFQLEDPARYVLELVAAAVCAGAPRVDIRNDADDFEVTFRGEAPTEAELATLWDHLFARDAQGRDAMLQHLATGVLAALATKPRWIRIDRGETDEAGAVRLAVSDPTETRPEPLDDRELVGTRVHVRERVSPAVLREALMGSFADPAEARLVRGACHQSPIPLRLNGTELPRAVEPPLTLLDVPLLGERKGQLWLVPPGAFGVVEIVRHGLVMAEVRESLGRCALVGVLHGDELRLNASRSMVVDDERRKKLMTELDEALDQALRVGLPERMAAVDANEVLRWSGETDQAVLRFRATRKELLLDVARAGVVRLAGRGPLEGPLTELPLVHDLFARSWSVRALRELTQPPAVLEDPALADESLARPQFDRRHQQLLEAMVGGAVEDLTRTCQLRAEGRKRRAEAARRRREPRFSRGPQREFADGALRGAVRWDEGRGSDQRGLSVRLRLSGMGVQTVSVPCVAGNLEAIVDHPEFRVDHAFLHVSPDDTYKRAVSIAQEQAEHFVREHLPAGLTQAPERWLPALADLVEPQLPKEFTAFRKICDGLPAELVDVPCLRSGEGVLLTLRQVAAAPVTSPWWMLEVPEAGALPDALRDQVVVVPAGQRDRWRRILKGCTRRGGRNSLDAAAVRAKRLAEPRQEAVLPAHGPAELEDQRKGMKLALAWLPTTLGPAGGEGWSQQARQQAWVLKDKLGGVPGRECRIAVLRDGVFIGIAQLQLPLDGVAGWVDWPRAPTDDAMTALTRDGVAKLEEVLDGAADELAAAGWKAWVAARTGGELPTALGAWLATRRKQARQVLDLVGPEQPIARWADGQVFDLSDLDRLRRKRIKVILVERHPPDLPGLGNVLVARAGAAVAVRAWSRHPVEDGRERLDELAARLERYLRRPVHDPAVAMLLTRIHTEDGVTWELGLPAAPNLIGRQDVSVLWRQRLLTQRDGGQGLGCLVTVSGKGVQPDENLTSVANKGLVKRAKELARSELLAMIAEAIERHGRRVEHAAAFRALASRVGDSSRPGSKALRSQGVLERLGALALFQDHRGHWMSAVQVADLESQGARVRVISAELANGPVDATPYVLADPFVVDALAVLLGHEVEPGNQHLQTWRVGQRRRQGLERREARLAPEVRLRAAVSGPHEGEVGLVPGKPGLWVVPLVDGLPLEHVEVPFPVAARAVVQGPAVRADAGFVKVVQGKAFNTLVEQLSQQLNTLADQACADWTGAGPATVEEVLQLWALENRRGRASSRAALFPTLGGGRVSVNELGARQRRDGGVGIVPSQVGGALPSGPQPLLHPAPRVLEALSERFELVDLSDVVRTPASQPALSLPDNPWWLSAWHRLDGPLGTGWIGVARGGTEGDGVLLVHQNVGLERVAVDFGFPVRGALAVRSGEPDGLWRRLVDRQQVARIQDWLADEAKALVPALVERAGAAEARKLLGRLVQRPADVADERLARLTTAPLFADSTSARGSLRDVLAQEPVRWVAPGHHGHHHPDRSRIWVLDASARALLSGLTQLAEAHRDLEVEDLGHRRRTGPLHRQDARAGARRFQYPELGVLGALWLEATAGEVQVLVEGRKAGTLGLGSARLHGWVNGSFPTSLSFEEPRLEEALLARLAGEAVAVLQDRAYPLEWRFGALQDALPARGGLATLLQQYPGVWGEVSLAADPDGRPLTLSMLLQAAEKHRRLLWVEPDALVQSPPDDEPVVVDEGGLVRVLQPHLPVRWVHVDQRVDVELPADQALDDQVLRDARARVEALAQSVSLAPDASVRRAAAHWLGAEGGPPWLAAAHHDDRVALLVAWRVATRAREDVGTGEEELALIDALLDRLGEG